MYAVFKVSYCIGQNFKNIQGGNGSPYPLFLTFDLDKVNYIILSYI
jgi:hypothetical protein